MSIAVDLDDRRGPISYDLANELIAASAAHPSDKVMIAGADHLDLLIALIRRGFSSVDCQSAACGPHAPRGETDVLIAPSVRSETDLGGILQRLGPSLRPHGVIVVHSATTLDPRDERRLRQRLVEAGFTAIEPLASPVGHLWYARRQAAAMACAA